VHGQDVVRSNERGLRRRYHAQACGSVHDGATLCVRRSRALKRRGPLRTGKSVQMSAAYLRNVQQLFNSLPMTFDVSTLHHRFVF